MCSHLRISPNIAYLNWAVHPVFTTVPRRPGWCGPAVPVRVRCAPEPNLRVATLLHVRASVPDQDRALPCMVWGKTVNSYIKEFLVPNDMKYESRPMI